MDNRGLPPKVKLPLPLRQSRGAPLGLGVGRGARSFVAELVRQVRLNLHPVMQNPTNANQVSTHRPIKQEVSRPADQAILCSRAIAAVAQMVAAHREPKFRPRSAAGAFWIGGNVS